jgi:hypothetical protein
MSARWHLRGFRWTQEAHAYEIHSSDRSGLSIVFLASSRHFVPAFVGVGVLAVGACSRV